jgi:hypothetical protein
MENRKQATGNWKPVKLGDRAFPVFGFLFAVFCSAPAARSQQSVEKGRCPSRRRYAPPQGERKSLSDNANRSC